MRVWLELSQEEGASLFEAVKGFTVDRLKTAEVSVRKDESSDKSKDESGDKPDEEVVAVDQAAAKEVSEKPEDKPAVTLEIVRAALTERKRSGMELKALFRQFGASKLSEVAAQDYALLMKKAEAL